MVRPGFAERKAPIPEWHRSWRKPAVAIGLALVLQAVILGVAVLVGVMDPLPHKEASLKLAKGSPMRAREQRQQVAKQVAQLNRMQGDMLDRLMDPVRAATEPAIPVNQPDLSTSFQAMTTQLPMGSFFAEGMQAALAGAESDSLPLPDPVQFLGESLQAQRVVLLLDVSGSVKTKMERAGLSMNQLREEVGQFIDQLGPNHLFGIIQFTRNWQSFNSQLLPAAAAVKSRAREWLDTSFRTTGTSGRNWTRGSPNGIEGVLDTAFAMDPQLDEIFLLSDGDFQRTPPGGGGQDVPWEQLRQRTRSLQAETVGQTRLRLVCFYPPEEALPDLRAWVRENGPGSLRIER